MINKVSPGLNAPAAVWPLHQCTPIKANYVLHVDQMGSLLVVMAAVDDLQQVLNKVQGRAKAG
jgi:hypothetical protein